MPDGAVRPTLKNLSRHPSPGTDDFLDALGEIENCNDRAAGIVAATFVEDAVRWAIGGYLISALTNREEAELFNYEAPLSTFNAKIIIAHALGIFGNVARDDLVKLKNIRNAFAHAARPVLFTTPEVAQECARLRYLDAVAEKPDREIMQVRKPITLEPRSRFLATARVLMLDLHAVVTEHRERLGGMP